MKLKITIPIMFLAVFGASAQDNYMALSFGLSNPIGDFSKTSSLASDGYAKTGFLADYSGAYYLTHHLALGGNIKFTQHTIHEDPAEEELLDLLPEDFTGSVTELNVGFWYDVSFAVGPQYTYQVGMFKFDAYLFPGIHIVHPPSMEIVAKSNRTYYSTVISAQKLRLGFETGVAARIDISETTGIRLFCSYLLTNSKGTITLKDDDENSTGSISLKRNIQMLNTGIGLIYKI